MWKQGPKAEYVEKREKSDEEGGEEFTGRKQGEWKEIHRIPGVLLHAGEQSQGEVAIRLIRPGSGIGMEWNYISSQPNQSQVSIKPIHCYSVWIIIN